MKAHCVFAVPKAAFDIANVSHTSRNFVPYFVSVRHIIKAHYFCPIERNLGSYFAALSCIIKSHFCSYIGRFVLNAKPYFIVMISAEKLMGLGSCLASVSQR